MFITMSFDTISEVEVSERPLNLCSPHTAELCPVTLNLQNVNKHAIFIHTLQIIRLKFDTKLRIRRCACLEKMILPMVIKKMQFWADQICVQRTYNKNTLVHNIMYGVSCHDNRILNTWPTRILHAHKQNLRSYSKMLDTFI